MEAILNLEDFLRPIAEDNPVGQDIRYEDEYFELEEARRADEDSSSQRDWQRERKVADWHKVSSLGQELLVEKSKDLQVAAWVTEALFHLHGMAGWKSGIDLVRGLQGRFWDRAHPAEGDLELRRGVYEFLDEERIFSILARMIPVTQVRGAQELSYSLLKYRESRESENLLKKPPKDIDPEELISGRLRAADFDKAFESTDRQFYVGLLTDLAECQAALEQLNADIRQRWKEKNPPTLSRLPVAFKDVEKLAKQLLDKKPAPASEPEEATQEDVWEESAAAAPVEETAVPEEQESPAPRPAARKARAVKVDDPRAQIAQAAHALRLADQADPTPYVVLRALGMGALYRAGEPLKSVSFPSPSSEVRTRLYELATGDSSDSKTMLEESEQALGEAEGTAWLDLHRYALTAMASEGLEDAARACKALLHACLRDKPDWPATQLKDGTPCASEATRSWIRDQKLGAEAAPEVLPRRASEPSPSPEPASDGAAVPAGGATREPDPWDEAVALRQSGRTTEAIALLARAARQARTGRERFLRTLEQAELCQAAGRIDPALPLLEGLAQRVDEFHLEEWEDSGLCARVFSNLYRCLRGKDDSRARSVYNRLCRIDLTEALALDGQ
jgi:type VI secretion system ImpA family protein